MINTSVDNIPADCDIAVVQITLVERARKSVPQAQIVTLQNFLALLDIFCFFKFLVRNPFCLCFSIRHFCLCFRKTLSAQQIETTEKQILVKDGVQLNLAPVSKEQAIQAAGELLAKLGYVDKTYVDAMQEREKLVSTPSFYSFLLLTDCYKSSNYL